MKHFLIYTALALWCATGFLTRVLPNKIVLTCIGSPMDYTLQPMGAYALKQGLIIHKDFHSPLGITTYLPDLWAMKVWGNTWRVPLQGSGITFVFFSLVTFGILRTVGYDWVITAAGTALISLTAANPDAFGIPPGIIYEGEDANMIGIAWCMLVVLIAIKVPATLERSWMAGACIGIGMVWAGFIKVNYGAEILPIAALGLWAAGKWRPQYPLVLFMSAIMTALVIMTAYHVDLGAMHRDIGLAAHCRAQYISQAMPMGDTMCGQSYQGYAAMWLWTVKRLLCHQYELFVLLLALVLAVNEGFMRLREAVALLALGLFVLLCDLGFGLVASYGSALPTLPVLALVLASRLPVKQILRYLMLAMVGGYCAIMGFNYAVEFAQDTGLTQPRGVVEAPETLTAPDWKGVNYCCQICDGFKGIDWMAKWNDGMALLKSGDKTAVLDQDDPFIVFMNLPFPEGGAVFDGAWATFDEQWHLAPEDRLGDCDTILIPDGAFENQAGVQLWLSVYGKYLEAHFGPVFQDGYWVVLKRKAPGGTSK